MKRIKVLLSGASIGVLLGLLSLTFTAIVVTILFGRMARMEHPLPIWLSLAPFSMINGFVVGGLSAGLGRSFESRELTVFTCLISIAIGSVLILLGDFDNQSLMPFAIYFLAGFNGLCSAAVVASLIDRSKINGGKRFAA